MISRQMPTFLAIVLVLVAVVQGMMLTYRDALKEVVNREADDSVFAAFWRDNGQINGFARATEIPISFVI